MLWYIVKLIILLPLIGGMIWGSLKLAQKMQAKIGGGVGGRGGAARSVRITETVMLSPTLKLAVLEFHGREILVSVSRGGLTRLAEAPARAGVQP
jgi:flagellar protein FliO/FliZ